MRWRGKKEVVYHEHEGIQRRLIALETTTVDRQEVKALEDKLKLLEMNQHDTEHSGVWKVGVYFVSVGSFSLGGMAGTQQGINLRHVFSTEVEFVSRKKFEALAKGFAEIDKKNA